MRNRLNHYINIRLVMIRLSWLIMLTTVFCSPIQVVTQGMPKYANELSKEMVNLPQPIHKPDFGG